MWSFGCRPKNSGGLESHHSRHKFLKVNIKMKIDKSKFKETIKEIFNEYNFMVKLKFSKLKIYNYYHIFELYISGYKDDGMPLLKLTVKTRLDETYFQLYSVNGLKKSYKDPNDLLNNIEKDINYFFVEKDNYTIDELK